MKTVAYDEGVRAYCDGRDRADNPYQDQVNSQQWDKGYTEEGNLRHAHYADLIRALSMLRQKMQGGGNNENPNV